ncbi:MAG: GNAT family N-acetyltransferase [Bacteroidota bacterium]
MIALKEVQSKEEYQIAIQLFKEYGAQIGIDLSFQNFEQELRDIHTQYARPHGILMIAYDKDKHPIGCFGIRKFADTICELKRMYLKKEARGKGLGKELLLESIRLGQQLAYKHMRLDTLPSMESAIRLYKKTGFYEIEPYRYNPIKGTKYFEIQLKTESQ